MDLQWPLCVEAALQSAAPPEPSNGPRVHNWCAWLAFNGVFEVWSRGGGCFISWPYRSMEVDCECTRWCVKL